MATTKLILGDAKNYMLEADLILTDPPYELPGDVLRKILKNYKSNHLVMLTTMKQLLEFMKSGDWEINFDFVIDGVIPKKSKSYSQPNYTHQTGVYLTRNNVKSIFNRKLRPRSDVFTENGYWPTIFYAPRNTRETHGHAKNKTAITDLLGTFDCLTVLDPFCGSGTTGLAALELRRDCTLIEIDESTLDTTARALRCAGAVVEYVKS